MIAQAGPLSQTAHGIDNKIDTHTSHDSSPPPPSPPDPPRPPPRDECSGCGTTAVVLGASSPVYYSGGASYATVEEGSGSSAPLLPGPGRLDLYLGAHSVVGSDGAMLGEVRASKDWLGLAVSGIRYVEHVEDGKREDNVSLYLTAFTLSGRLLQHESTEMWLDGGLAVSGSSEYESIVGSAWSLRGEHGLNPDLALRGQARYYVLEHGVSAMEAWGGVRAWFLQAGYRVLKFNVGPALHGPEAGVALRF
jgi:hypothetical protein